MDKAYNYSKTSGYNSQVPFELLNDLSYLTFEDCVEVIVSEEYAQVSFLDYSVQFTEAMVC